MSVEPDTVAAIGTGVPAAVRWVRQRLERLIAATSDNPGPKAAPASPPHVQVLLEADPSSGFSGLCTRLGLSDFEADVLMLAVSAEFDTRIPELCARAHGDPSRPHPSFSLAFALFEEPAWSVLAPDRPLRYWRLLDVQASAGQPLISSALRAEERIVNLVKGLDHIDAELALHLVDFPVPSAAVELPASQRASADAIERGIRFVAAPRGATVMLLGPDAESKLLIAREVASRFGSALARLALDTLPGSAAALERLARLWHRESLLADLALFVDASEIDSLEPGLQATLRRFLARAGGIVFVATRERWAALGTDHPAFEIARPSVSEQRAIWAEALGDAAAARRLAGQFDLNGPSILQLVASVRAPAAETSGNRSRSTRRRETGDPLETRLWDACRARLQSCLDGLAARIVPTAGWDNIVLPSEQRSLLRALAAQVAHRSTVHEDWGFAARGGRGLGITALFAGESGTGKTLAAEVIAGALRLDLYRIDLSGVVSKYIGETERNLRRVFDAAENAGAVLFFDEADALFGKRSEVKDSHDRYANIEVNYLLQRMESYRGVAILATNAKSALDQAFLRRLRFLIDFPYPGREERRLIWQKAFPAGAPLGELDPDRLSRLNLTGGNIHTVAINAAFLAAATGSVVTMRHVLEAARSEMRKLDRPVDESLFRCDEAAEAIR